ncbi:unnamed protein product [Vitrella brassicaformis CCMP3155]|uniref:non-specific serine/threonine protein kinase n=4 Tax=Vitrella brassicaformis TaxID=1169539 RepID=A0A0G4EWZ2_VITBC|nr:unnamed protein product [Vitrella brassicaformis CCMP3155]|eukprot:CEM02918.1 unnamed protein product [Vitrella brassicaformis CCMP3155]
MGSALSTKRSQAIYRGLSSRLTKWFRGDRQGSGLSVLKSIFKELASHSRSKNQTVDKETFLRYFPLPGMLGERLFAVFDKDKNEGIDFQEFFTGLALIYHGSPDEKKKFLFDMYDLDENGYITREELYTMLTHIPAAFKILDASLHAEGHGATAHFPQWQQDESLTESDPDLQTRIDDIVEGAFLDKDETSNGLAFDEFCRIVQKSPEILEMMNIFYDEAMPEMPPIPSHSSPQASAPNIARSLSLHTNDKPANTRHKAAVDRLKSGRSITFTSGEDASQASQAEPPSPPFLPATPPSFIACTFSPLTSPTARKDHAALLEPGGGGGGGGAGHGHHLGTATASWGHMGGLGSASSQMSRTPPAPSSSDDGTLSAPRSPMATPSSPHFTCIMCKTELLASLNHCPRCGSALSANQAADYFCESCNWSLREIRYCFVCGQPLQPNLISAQYGAGGPAASRESPQPTYASLPSVGAQSGGTNGSGNGVSPSHSQSFTAVRRSDSRVLRTRTEECVMQTEGDMSGWLSKVGQKLGMMKQRYFVLRDRLLYYYASDRDRLPRGVIFVSGSYVRAHRSDDASKRLGIEIKSPNERVRYLYCNSAQDREEWVQALVKASKSVSIHEFYSLKEKIGRGKYGEVYKAVHKATLSEVAVKILPKTSMNEAEREYLRMEVAILKLVQHPHIVKLLDIFETSEHLYLVMEHFPAGDLAEWIYQMRTKEGKRRLPERVAQRIIKRVLSALRYLHSRGITHRDLKPENILLVTSRTVFCCSPNRLTRAGTSPTHAETGGGGAADRFKDAIPAAMDESEAARHEHEFSFSAHGTKPSIGIDESIIRMAADSGRGEGGGSAGGAASSSSSSSPAPSRETTDGGPNRVPPTPPPASTTNHLSIPLPHSQASPVSSPTPSPMASSSQGFVSSPTPTPLSPSFGAGFGQSPGASAGDGDDGEGGEEATGDEILDIKLTDFGLSKIQAPTRQMSESLGTLSYAAPEIILGKPYDSRVDIWSTGVIAYWLLSGELPFQGDDDQSIAEATVRCEYRFDTDDWAGVSDTAKEFVSLLLKRWSKDRPTCEQSLQHRWIHEGSPTMRRSRTAGADPATHSLHLLPPAPPSPASAASSGGDSRKHSPVVSTHPSGIPKSPQRHKNHHNRGGLLPTPSPKADSAVLPLGEREEVAQVHDPQQGQGSESDYRVMVTAPPQSPQMRK